MSPGSLPFVCNHTSYISKHKGPMGDKIRWHVCSSSEVLFWYNNLTHFGPLYLNTLDFILFLVTMVFLSKKPRDPALDPSLFIPADLF